MANLGPALAAAGMQHLQYNVEDDDSQDLGPYLADGAAFVQRGLASEGLHAKCLHFSDSRGFRSNPPTFPWLMRAPFSFIFGTLSHTSALRSFSSGSSNRRSDNSRSRGNNRNNNIGD